MKTRSLEIIKVDPDAPEKTDSEGEPYKKRLNGAQVKLYAKYKSSSDSRIKISNNSSSEYFSDFSNVWEN